MAKSELAVGVHGATGRMGTRIIQLMQADPGVRLAAAIDRAGHPQIGQDAGVLAGVGPLGVLLQTELDPSARLDAIIDFSLPAGTLALARVCRERKIPMVVGTTGLEPGHKAEVEEIASAVAVMISPNMSRAVNLLFRLAAEAARAIGASSDIEIVERHHKYKKDAPSGTALRLAEVIGEAIGSGPDRYAHGRHGDVGARPKGEIGLHALRTGDNPGEHTVVFGLMGESLELSHRALNRDGFVRGAIEAAKFLAGKPPGLYTMADLLGG